jgi:ubiquitin C-terminal hydrolase
VLDLSHYQDVTSNPALLKYRLKGVLCHGGSLGGGHWMATVVDKMGVNRIDDHRVQGREKGYLRMNPQDGMQGVVLVYTRIWQRKI